jgi:peptide/nickel transport system substrate-binding protein
MTDRVIEMRLIAPRPNLLPLLAQPEFSIVRNGQGTGPFSYSRAANGELRLRSDVIAADEETRRREEVLLSGAPAPPAIQSFAAGKSDLVLGGTFVDLPYAQRVRLPRNSLRFDPASGLFGLLPLRPRGGLDDPDLRRALNQAIDRDNFVAALGVPGLTARATVLEPGLDGIPVPVAPAWAATPLADRLPALQADVNRMFGKDPRPPIRVALPDGPGSDLLMRELARDWGALGFTVERARNGAPADFALVDEVAPSSSPAWFVRRFRCGAAPLCDAGADQLLEAARTTLVPAQRYALLAQAAARIDDEHLFMPLAAPVRWSLVARRIVGFAGNRYARHTLTDLEQKPGGP